MVLFKHTPIYHLQYENRSWRMKQSIYGCLVQDHTGRQEKTEHLSSGLPPSVSCRRTALFCLMLHGSAWEEPGYCWAERQSKENPVATAADCRGRIPRLQLPVMFHAATLRWDRRREDVQKCFISLDKIHTLFYTPAFLCEHKDTETRMFVSVFSNTSNFPILC